MAYSLIAPILLNNILDIQVFYSETEIPKMQTEPPAIDAGGVVTSWAPSDFPSPVGMSGTKFNNYKDPTGFLDLMFRLRARYRIRKIYIWHQNGTPTFRIRATDGDFATWTTLYEEQQTGYNVYREIDIADIIVTDVRVEVNTYAYIPKIFFYAELIPGSEIADPPPSSILSQPKFGEFARTCTFGDTPNSVIPKGTERFYLDTRWLTEIKTYNTKDNILLRFDANITAVNNMDTVMAAKKGRDGGVFLHVNLKENPYYIEYADQGTSYDKENKWLDTALSDSYDPMSYQMAAAFFYSFTARYGANGAMADTYLRLMPGESVQKGLNYVDVIEMWNELDSWWTVRASYHQPTEMAAFFSACIDGHNGVMGDGFGIKTADPNMKVAFGGMVGLKKWLAWWVIHEMARLRGQTYDEVVALFDQIDWHHYMNDGDGQLTDRTTGVSPEDDNFLQRIVDTVDLRNRYHPFSKCVLGEFGWDYNQATDQKAPQIIHDNIATTQGAWLMRAMLIGYMAKADGLSWYMIKNANSGELDDVGRYATCGLTSSTYRNKYMPWYCMNMMVDHLYECDTISEINVGDNEVSCYRFTNSSDQTIEKIFIWCNTSFDNRKSNVSVPVGATMTKANKISPKFGQSSGEGYLLNISANKVIVDVDELPTLISTSQLAVEIPILTNVILLSKNINNISFSWVLGSFDNETLEIYRDNVLIETLLPSTTTYTDTSTGIAPTFDYRIVVKNNIGQTEALFTVDVPVLYTIDRQIKVDFNNDATYPTPADFTRVDTKNLTALFDTVGAATGISFQFLDNWFWFGSYGKITGDNSGVIPDNVLKVCMYPENNLIPSVCRLTGLDIAKTYVLKILGSRDYIGTQKQSIEVNGAGEIHDSGYNTSEFTTFYSISGRSQLDITSLGYEDGEQYINALFIEEVTVTGYPPIAPTANAGQDQVITLPTNFVILDGSGSTDGDGTIVSYLWVQLSGPNTANIVDSGSVITEVTGLIEGSYTFRLTVTDNGGLSDDDLVDITVNAQIVARYFKGFARGSFSGKAASIKMK